MLSLWSPCPVLPGCGARLTGTGLVSQDLSAQLCGEVSLTFILVGSNHRSIGWRQESVLVIRRQGYRFTCTVEASPLSCSSVPSNIPGALLSARRYSRHRIHVGPSSKICKVKSSKVLKVKMSCLYFATMLLRGKVFEVGGKTEPVAYPSVLGQAWELILPVLISHPVSS